MIMKLIREVLGRVIVFFDVITRPGKMKRQKEAQDRVDQEVQDLALYQFYACPFCVKVRRAIHRLNLKIPVRDAQKQGPYRQELLEGGGRIKVPCLRIKDNQQVKWMYESNDIIAYLNERFASIT